MDIFTKIIESLGDGMASIKDFFLKWFIAPAVGASAAPAPNPLPPTPASTATEPAPANKPSAAKYPESRPDDGISEEPGTFTPAKLAAARKAEEWERTLDKQDKPINVTRQLTQLKPPVFIQGGERHVNQSSGHSRGREGVMLSGNALPGAGYSGYGNNYIPAFGVPGFNKPFPPSNTASVMRHRGFSQSEANASYVAPGKVQRLNKEAGDKALSTQERLQMDALKKMMDLGDSGDAYKRVVSIITGEDEYGSPSKAPIFIPDDKKPALLAYAASLKDSHKRDIVISALKRPRTLNGYDDSPIYQDPDEANKKTKDTLKSAVNSLIKKGDHAGLENLQAMGAAMPKAAAVEKSLANEIIYSNDPDHIRDLLSHANVSQKTREKIGLDLVRLGRMEELGILLNDVMPVSDSYKAQMNQVITAIPNKDARNQTRRQLESILDASGAESGIGSTNQDNMRHSLVQFGESDMKLPAQHVEGNTPAAHTLYTKPPQDRDLPVSKHPKR